MHFSYKTNTVLLTFSLEAAFNMTYLVLPWIFSFQHASHETYITTEWLINKWNTINNLQSISLIYLFPSFNQILPYCHGELLSTYDQVEGLVLWQFWNLKDIKNLTLNTWKRLFNSAFFWHLEIHTHKSGGSALSLNIFANMNQKLVETYLLQLMITSSGWVLLFNMPCFGWSPLPRNRPGGSILKFPIFSLWPSIKQNPYSFWISSLFSFSAWWILNRNLIAKLFFLVLVHIKHSWWIIQLSN